MHTYIYTYTYLHIHLEIIIDLPIGFCPINNIISLSSKSSFQQSYSTISY